MKAQIYVVLLSPWIKGFHTIKGFNFPEVVYKCMCYLYTEVSLEFWKLFFNVFGAQ